jgi:hypothetical protein
MLFRPDPGAFAEMEAEVQDWYHPEHYGTYMPEQEYLSRWFGTFDKWSHIDCCFNFEIDKNERVPHDFTEAHEAIRAGGATGHVGARVLHFSGTGVKPWDLLLEKRGDIETLRVASVAESRRLLDRLILEGPGERMEGYVDAARLWDAMLEWLLQFVEASEAIVRKHGYDPLEVVRSTAAPATACTTTQDANDGYAGDDVCVEFRHVFMGFDHDRILTDDI